MAAEARSELGLGDFDPLDPWSYALRLNVLVLPIAGLDLCDADRRQLLATDSRSWSGLTLREAGYTAVVLNEAHPMPRQRSTLMHELAHVQLRHVANRVDVATNGLLLVSDYSVEQEEEANWLAGALLLPRAALLRVHAAGRTTEHICEQFGVSEELCKWRLRMTGILVQVARRARYGAA